VLNIANDENASAASLTDLMALLSRTHGFSEEQLQQVRCQLTFFRLKAPIDASTARSFVDTLFADG
jgi:hypothetical protein